MKITVIYPTRNRSSIAMLNFLSWQEKTSFDIEVEWILSVDKDDISDYSWFPFIIVFNDNRSCIDAINNAAKIATGDVFIVMSDDFECVNGWNILLAKEIYDKKDFLLKTNDGLQPTLVTLPILDREYYNRFGYIYCDEYFHLHCDEEMTIVALMLGRYIKSDIKFTHNHHTTGKFTKDELSMRNDSSWAQGQATLERRSLNNFGIETPICKREDIVWR